jgi:hypothetical protein
VPIETPPQWKTPADELWRAKSHKSETRVSAIADFVREGKQKKKALPLSLCFAGSART